MPIQTDSQLETFLDNATDPDGKTPYELGTADIAQLIQRLIEKLGQGDDPETSVNTFLDSRKSGNPDNRRYPGDLTSSDRPNHPQPMLEICFYYLKIQSDGSIASHIIREPFVPPGDINGRIRALVGRVMANPPTVSQDVDDVIWDKPCYLAFYLDNPAWKLFRKGNKNHALFFPEFNDGINQYYANKSFYNARDIQAGNGRVLIVENHHTLANDSGPRRRVGGKSPAAEHYKFDIYYRVEFDPPLIVGSEELKMTMIVDPGGRNTGP